MSINIPTLRIGTRDSKLAMWQALKVQSLLAEKGIQSEIVPTKSEGDLDLVTPLYAMGVQGVFTKTLDAYLLSNKVDIAVHSMKDVPIQLPQGIVEAAVLERASHKDVLVLKEEIPFDHSLAETLPLTIGTGSVRRKAQWINKYPKHKVENLRGNLQTRMQKLQESKWTGAIFAAAGLDRMEMRPANSIELDWMLPAPAQGAIMVVCRTEDEAIKAALAHINHDATAKAVKIERDFLAALMGGCATPISALATVNGEEIIFEGNVVTPEGDQKFEIKKTYAIDQWETAGQDAANCILELGVKNILDLIKNKKA